MENHPIHELRVEFDKLLNRIPKFINATDHLHFVLWQAMIECNSVLKRLVVNKILTDRQIAKIINDFNDFIEAIIDNTPRSLHINLSAYYTIILQRMLKRCDEEELYEVSSNIKRFSDFYFNNNEADA